MLVPECTPGTMQLHCVELEGEHYSKRYQIDMVDCARHVTCSCAARTFVYRLAMFQSVSPAPYALPTASSGATVRPISR